LICAAIYFLIVYWWVILIIVAIIAFPFLLLWFAYSKNIDNIVSAKIVDTRPIIKRVSEKTGHTTSYGRHLSYHEHYKERDVIAGYAVEFEVVYKNGKNGTINCKEDGFTYKKIIKKMGAA
jgi:hypothetical protein